MSVASESDGWGSHRALTVVKLIALSVVLLAMTYDFLAHVSSLFDIGVAVSFQLAYGSMRYELIASLYWGFTLLFGMVAVVAHSTQRALVTAAQ